MGHKGSFGQSVKTWKKLRDKITHEVPTGPHTDVRKRKLNPSILKKLQEVTVKKHTPPYRVKNSLPKKALPKMKRKP